MLGAFVFNWFSDYGAVFESGGSVAHTSMQRYVFLRCPTVCYQNGEI